MQVVDKNGAVQTNEIVKDTKLKKLQISIAIAALGVTSVNAQEKITEQLAEIGAKTALIVQSQAIDEHPIWSPDGEILGVNVMGTWWGLHVNDIELQPATWHQQTIAMWAGGPEAIELTDQQVASFRHPVTPSAREVTTKTGSTVALKPKGLGVEFSVSGNDGRDVWWTSELSTCFALTLSPNEKYVAYICPSNGLFIAKIGE